MLEWPSTFEFEDHRRRSKPRFTAVRIRISRLMMNHTGNPTYGLNKRRFKRVLKSPAFAAGLSNVRPFGLDFDPSPLCTASGLINSPPNASNRVPQMMVRTKKLSISNLICVAMVHGVWKFDPTISSLIQSHTGLSHTSQTNKLPLVIIWLSGMHHR